MRPGNAKNSGKNKLVVLILVIVAFGMLGLSNFSGFNPANSPSRSGQAPLGAQAPNVPSSRDLALGCTLDPLTRFHIHPHLTIVINGQRQVIPANIGVTFTCLRAIHTHDDTGTIHVESPAAADFTLGDFFAVWGKTFNQNQILDYKADVAHEIVMTVNGVPNEEYEKLVLRDKDEIVIEYKNI